MATNKYRLVKVEPFQQNAFFRIEQHMPTAEDSDNWQTVHQLDSRATEGQAKAALDEIRNRGHHDTITSVVEE